METPGNAVQTPQESRSASWATHPTASPPIACPCGCGRPPKPGGKYADPEACRRQVYNRLHPVFDLSGLAPSVADRARKLAEEAIVAAKLGQRRATVDLGGVKHEALREVPDTRRSNRIRLDDDRWEILEVMRVAWGLSSRTAVVERLIDRTPHEEVFG